MQNETKNRFFLVVVDETEELHQALHFACARAKSIDANIALVYVITPNDFGHWASVDALMREEACLLYTSPSPRDLSTSRMPSSA